MKRQFSCKSREERYFYAVYSTKEIQGDVNFPGKERKTRPFFEKRARKRRKRGKWKEAKFPREGYTNFHETLVWKVEESTMETLISRKETSNLHKG